MKDTLIHLVLTAAMVGVVLLIARAAEVIAGATPDRALLLAAIVWLCSHDVAVVRLFHRKPGATP